MLNFMGFGENIGIDLGTATVLVYIKGQGIVIREPSVVAIDRDTNTILSVGEEARRMLGRTPGNIVAIRPLREGVISNYEITEKMLKYFIQKAIQQIKEPFTTPKRFRVCSIDIISLIFDVDESYIPIISSAHLEKDVLRLLKQFPDKTFLEIALLQLCNKAFHIPELKDQFIDALIVPFIGGVKEQPETFVDRILIGFTFEILSTILNSNQSQNDEKEDFMNKIKAIPGYEDFENNFFKKRTRLMRIGYGGKRPIYRTKSTPYPF